MTRGRAIRSASDLVTTREATRAGFLEFAVEKNSLAADYVRQARELYSAAADMSDPRELAASAALRSRMALASGLSEKALSHLDAPDIENAIVSLTESCTELDNHAEEVVYRYLLFVGDSLGGAMRNKVGALAERRLVAALTRALRDGAIGYSIQMRNQAQPKTKWITGSPEYHPGSAPIKAISWTNGRASRTLVLNIRVPAVGKNVDLCLLDAAPGEYLDAVASPERYLMLGELKGGIDPAGADEHWKTAKAALERIRSAFKLRGLEPHITFVGASIVGASEGDREGTARKTMAEELWQQYDAGDLEMVANLTIDAQLMAYCDWLVSL